jgi:ABC-type transport system involved in cytochrome c biogenesis permease subunit
VVCFGLFFSFVGTVLGGLWGDDSWGRFWGWDPKENGAMMIVLWNALLIHARWDKMIASLGFGILAIFGNIITAWSMFGTNLLGVGLHSYGFNKDTFYYLVYFALSQAIMIGLGIVVVFLRRSSSKVELS